MSFNDESKLCNKCYTVQLNIIHDTEPISEDSKLCMLMHEIQAIEKLNSIDGALLEMVSKIGNFLLNHKIDPVLFKNGSLINTETEGVQTIATIQ